MADQEVKIDKQFLLDELRLTARAYFFPLILIWRGVRWVVHALANL